MNLETFEQTVVPTLGKHKITTKGFYMRYRLQSIYKTEFPYNNEYERYFVIEDNVYKLSDSAKIDVNQAFKQESDCNNIVFSKNERTTLVNVPFERFILVNEQVTDNLIIVDKDRSSETTEQEQMEKWSKIDAKVEQSLQDIDEKLENERIMREAKNMVYNSLETTQDYYQFLQNRANNIVNTIISKDREYTESHWLENFEEACKEEGLEINCENLLKILNGYRLKHKVSINKIQRDILKGKILNQDLINEKYGDYINFMLIEQAIILKYNHINKVSF
jgi:hypothetical protein